MPRISLGALVQHLHLTVSAIPVYVPSLAKPAKACVVHTYHQRFRPEVMHQQTQHAVQQAHTHMSTVHHSRRCHKEPAQVHLHALEQTESNILMTGMLIPSALSKLTMLSTSRRLLAPRDVDLSLSLALISVFMLFA